MKSSFMRGSAEPKKSYTWDNSTTITLHDTRLYTAEKAILGGKVLTENLTTIKERALHRGNVTYGSSPLSILDHYATHNNRGPHKASGKHVYLLNSETRNKREKNARDEQIRTIGSVLQIDKIPTQAMRRCNKTRIPLCQNSQEHRVLIRNCIPRKQKRFLISITSSFIQLSLTDLGFVISGFETED